MSFALILRGKSDLHSKTLDNIRETVINDLSIKTIYMSTYDHANIGKVTRDYNPVYYKIQKVIPGTDVKISYISIGMHLVSSLERVQKDIDEGRLKETWMIITRFDAWFKETLSSVLSRVEYGLDPTKLYCLCRTEDDGIDDNLYVLHVSNIKYLLEIMRSIFQGEYSTHQMRKHIEKLMGTDKVAFLFPGQFYLQLQRPLILFTREMQLKEERPDVYLIDKTITNLSVSSGVFKNGQQNQSGGIIKHHGGNLVPQ